MAPFSPLVRGVIIGEYKYGEDPSPNSRAGRGDRSIMELDFRKSNFEFVDAGSAHIQDLDMTLVDFAMFLLFNNKLVTSVVFGPRTVDQLQTRCCFLGKGFTAADEALVNSLCASGYATSFNFIDTRYTPRRCVSSIH